MRMPIGQRVAERALAVATRFMLLVLIGAALQRHVRGAPLVGLSLFVAGAHRTGWTAWFEAASSIS